MSIIPEPTTTGERINDSLVEDAIRALTVYKPKSAQQAADMLLFWVRRAELTDADLAEVQRRMFPADNRLADAEYRRGYAEGYLDCAREAAERAAERERESQSLDECRDRLVETCMSGLVTVGMLSAESADALSTLWARRDRLTPVELDAIRTLADAEAGSR